MAVSARFYVQEVKQMAYAAGAKPSGSVILQASLKPEANKAWAQATPSGRMEMTLRGEILGWFTERLGKDIAITLDDVPEP